ncbi:MAG: PepSY domain-containing protein [Chthoniobacterales bacterium]
MKINKNWTVMLAAIALVGLTTSTLLAEQPDPKLLKAAKITQADAQKTALAKVPNGTVKSAELENEGGALVWSFDINKPNSKDIAEVLVDAKTGKIVKMENENPKQQANEAAADKKAKK